MRTGQPAFSLTLWLTLPMTTCFRPDKPREPMITSSASDSRASFTISTAGMDDGVIGAQRACLVVGRSNGKNLDIGCFVQVHRMSCILDGVKRRLGAVGCEDQRLQGVAFREAALDEGNPDPTNLRLRK